MGQYKETSKTLNTAYEYKNATVIVLGNYTKDATTMSLQNINGQCYRVNQSGEQGENFGYFSGYMRDGIVKYSMSEMSHDDAEVVWDIIEEIEPQVIGTDEE